MPYRDPGEIRLWKRSQGAVHLEVEAGRAFHPRKADFVDVGLPFGPKPRLILAYLNGEALKTGSPVIEVEESLTAFVQRIGLCQDGRSICIVKGQLSRLAASEIRLALAYGDQQARQVNAHIVGEFDLWFPKDTRQRVLWPTTVRLDPRYFDSLQRHAVPLDERAVAALSHSAMGLDIYAWLAQRLHRVEPGQPAFIPWKCIKEQFGHQYGRMDNFKRVFYTRHGAHAVPRRPDRAGWTRYDPSQLSPADQGAHGPYPPRLTEFAQALGISPLIHEQFVGGCTSTL